MDAPDLIRMANQIAGFFRSYGEAAAVGEIADHINRFWEPRMRSAFLALVAAGGEGLDPLARSAAPLIRKPHSSAA